MTAMRVFPRELLRYATDEELDWYVQFLAAQVDAESNHDGGAWELQPRQQIAEDFCTNLDPGMSHEILYGGALGGGKSEWLLWHMYHLALRYPGFSGLMLRRTYPELRRSLIIRSLEKFDHPNKCRYVVTEFTWKFRNGSRIEFGYCESDNDVHQYQSAEYDCIAFDELTQWPPGNDEAEGFASYPYLYLFSRLRSRTSLTARGFVPHIVAATNPGNVGGGWVKARFIDTGKPEQRTVHKLKPVKVGGTVVERYGSRVFIPAKLDDNKYLDKESYVAGLANMDATLVAALLDGSWDVVEGQFFTEWNRQIHVIRPFEIPNWWARVGGVDYGYAKPFAYLDVAFDQDGTAYVYREHYGAGFTPSQQCALIKNGTGPHERISYRVADPSMWANTGVGQSVAQQYANHHIPLRRAMNARVAGWARVREYLRIEPGADGAVRSGLYVFDTCPNLIRTLPMLVRDTTKPEDLDTDGEDHAADALRYILMSRPPRSRPPKREPNTLEERIAERRRERERAKQGKRGVDHPLLGRI